MFQSNNFSISPQFLPQMFITDFTTNFYHKLLPQTTIIIGVSISTTTPIFVPIQQFFNFTTNFTTNFYHIFYHKCYHKLLPQTTIIIGESISTTTPIFVQIQFFLLQFYHIYHTFYNKFYHKPLPLSPSTPTMFSVPKRNTYKCFERPAKIFIAFN